MAVPAKPAWKSWRYTIKVQRLDIARHLADNPGPPAQLLALLGDSYASAVLAAGETGLPEGMFLATCLCHISRLPITIFGRTNRISPHRLEARMDGLLSNAGLHHLADDPALPAVCPACQSAVECVIPARCSSARSYRPPDDPDHS
jgi:hypothetical protein